MFRSGKALALAAAFLAFALPARAEKITLTYAQVAETLAAVAGLDGATRVVRDPRGNEQAVTERYRYTPDAILKIAELKNALRAHADVFNAAKDNLIATISGGAGLIAEGTPEAARFGMDIARMSRESVTIDVRRIEESDLDLARNQQPPGVVAGLAPVLAKPEPGK